MKHRTPQRLQRLRRHATTVAALLFAATGFTASAQPCNNVSSLDINTGYDYVANSLVPNGQPDPEWFVSNLTPNCSAVPGAVAIGANARVANTAWASLSSVSGWISFLNSGTYTISGSQPVMSYGMTLSRNFRVCQDDDFTFALQIANDNFCTQIDIDGNPIAFSQVASTATGNFTAFTPIAPFTTTLTAGTHTINVRVHNYPITGSNPHGLNLLANIQSASGQSTLIGPGSPDDCTCMNSPSCSDTCYWKVSGNNIIGNNNIFGTLTKDDVRIKTSAQDRGIFTLDGLLGWNTMKPTAYLHVYCDGHNKEDGKLSDVRFERLERGMGNILVINEEGYVLDSKIPITRANAALEIEALKQSYEVEKERNDRLERELAEVKAKLNLLLENKLSQAKLSGSNELYQNAPNPANGQTVIAYNINTMKRDAYIVISAASGQMLQEYKINSNGYGKITFDGSKLPQGAYFYTLVVDQEPVATRKMVLQ